jgi:predicted nucleotidyltransferase component of viral defense system
MEFSGSKPKIDQSRHNNTILYRFESEIAPVINMRLKIEINSRGHFNVLRLKESDFNVQNSWFTGKSTLINYELEELFGTKRRALYQRKKSRDLFDLYWAYTHHKIDTEKLLHCYREYMQFVVDVLPSQNEFISNVEEKMNDPEFNNDIHMVLRPGIEYNNEEAFKLIRTELLEEL